MLMVTVPAGGGVLPDELDVGRDATIDELHLRLQQTAGGVALQGQDTARTHARWAHAQGTHMQAPGHTRSSRPAPPSLGPSVLTELSPRRSGSGKQARWALRSGPVRTGRGRSKARHFTIKLSHLF